MALTRTTASAIALADTEVVLASITALAVNDMIKVDNEYMRVQQVGSAATVPVKVLRGVNGSAAAAHNATAGAVFGPPSDWTNSGGSTPGRRRRDIISYSAAGAITLPTPGRDMIAILVGTSTLAMTLAQPSKDNEGDMLIVVSNGKGGAHTVTCGTTSDGFGDGGSGYDVLTYATGARNCSLLIAVNERWLVLPSLVGGTATAVTQTIA